jgi:hypothetical protein
MVGGNDVPETGMGLKRGDRWKIVDDFWAGDILECFRCCGGLCVDVDNCQSDSRDAWLVRGLCQGDIIFGRKKWPGTRAPLES